MMMMVMKKQKNTGFLLKDLIHITRIQKPYYLLYIPIVVTEIKFLDKNPEYDIFDEGVDAAEYTRDGDD